MRLARWSARPISPTAFSLPLSSTSHIFLASLHTTYLADYLSDLPVGLKQKLTLLETITVAAKTCALVEDGRFAWSDAVSELFGELCSEDLGTDKLGAEDEGVDGVEHVDDGEKSPLEATSPIPDGASGSTTMDATDSPFAPLVGRLFLSSYGWMGDIIPFLLATSVFTGCSFKTNCRTRQPGYG
ncbi:hypothetical protein JCM11641_008183 [Rhodosporidiobolus odoratus]